MDKVIALCKRRGFVYAGSEIYGGLSNSWDYGPLGTELKNNIKTTWWKRFVHMRDDIVGLDAALIMNPKVWEASGHLENFSDPLIECEICNMRVRADDLEAKKQHEDKHKGENTNFTGWTDPKMFNLMFKTFIGPTEESANIAYLRPETAQSMFVNFKRVLETNRVRIPFGIAQIGRAFRNEITPGNFIFRTREFEQMEIEYFIAPPQSDSEWQKVFEMWRHEMISWMKDDLGLDMSKVHELDVPESDRAHYSKRTIDFEFDFPFGTKELYGLAYRTDFDLANHQKHSGANLTYKDSETGEEYIPHVIEPTWGVDRSCLAVLINSYSEENGRVVLRLPRSLAPYKAAVFPLVANKPELMVRAKEIYTMLKKQFVVAFDDRGNIGKRYAAQDEVGTPFCITIDYETLEASSVTVRDRDSGKQERVAVDKLLQHLSQQFV